MIKFVECAKWMWCVTAGNRSRVSVSSVAGVVDIVASMSFVWFCKELIDAAVSKDKDGMFIFILGMMLSMLLQIVCVAFKQYMENISNIHLKNKLRSEVFHTVMQSRWDGKESLHTGDSVNRFMEDVRLVAETVTKSVPACLVAAIQFVAAFVFLFMLDPVLACIIPCLMLSLLFAGKRYVDKMRVLNGRIREMESALHSGVQEKLQNRVTIGSLGGLPYAFEMVDKQQRSLYEGIKCKTRISVISRIIVRIGFFAGYVSAFLWGVYGICTGVATFGMMTAFLQLVGQIQRPIIDMAGQLPSIINSITSIERLIELYSSPKEIYGDDIRLKGKVGVRFINVNYSYPKGNSYITDNFSFDFLPGTITALVGETGTGKSTLLRIVLGLLHPSGGKVCIYNSDTDVEVSTKTRCNFVYVPQGNTLMSGTIRENLLLGNPQATQEQINEALYTAAADFVFDLPCGLDTYCGENGAGLSEGQAQRISIARALLHGGSVLLMDEPTASLDSATENLFLKRLSGNLENYTAIISTHRESVMKICSKTLSL